MPNHAISVGSARLNADVADVESVESPSEAVWNAIGEQANRCRQGQPDILNVNSNGSAGLANQWQQRLNGKFFNSHIVPLPQYASSSENEVPMLPVMFAQSPDPGGKGTASSAADWLELGADKRAPIFQFVHPVSLERGCYKREVSLIEMLKREDPQGRLYEVTEIPGSVEQGLAGLPSDCRHFRVRKRTSGNDAPGEWTDVVLLASRLRSGVMPAANIEAAATSIATVMQQHLPSIDGMPIFMSYGGFGRSSCVGLYMTIQEQIQCNPELTLEQCLSMLEDFVIQGKAHRGRQFVPTHAQYEELKAAIEIVWTKLRTEPATLPHSEEPIEELEELDEINLQPPPLLPSDSLLARQVSFAERQESPPNSESSFISGHFEQAPAAQSGFAPLKANTRTFQPSTELEAVIDLASRQVNLGPGIKGPYMPIDVDGIERLAHAYPFPDMNRDRAAEMARDIVLGGFYGDALGSDLESTPYEKRCQILEEESRRQSRYLRPNDLGGHLKQLRCTNHRKRHAHGPTDDTQQGVLSCQAGMDYLERRTSHASGEELPRLISDSFALPSIDGVSLRIRGGADTIKMVQQRKHMDWKDRPIQDLRIPQLRAGGAGNGGMMRTAYDLLPLLALEQVDTKTVIAHTLLSNQVTHPSSFSAVACVGHNLTLLKCMANRYVKPDPDESYFFMQAYWDSACALEHRDAESELSTFGLLHSETNGHGAPGIDWRQRAFNSLDRWGEHGQVEADAYRTQKDRFCTPRRPSQFLSANLDEPAEGYPMGAPVLSSHDDRANLTILKMGSVEHALEDPKVREIRHRFSRGENLTMGDVDYLNTVLNRWGSSAYLGATYPAVVFLLEVLGYGDPLKTIEITALLTKDSDTCAAIVGQVVTALHGSDWINCDAGVRIRTSPEAPFELLPDFTDDLTGTLTDERFGRKAQPIKKFIVELSDTIKKGIR